jgi:hypothetical protein
MSGVRRSKQHSEKAKSDLMNDARRHGRVSGVDVGEVVHATFVDVFFDEGKGLEAGNHKAQS